MKEDHEGVIHEELLKMESELHEEQVGIFSLLKNVHDCIKTVRKLHSTSLSFINT